MATNPHSGVRGFPGNAPETSNPSSVAGVADAGRAQRKSGVNDPGYRYKRHHRPGFTLIELLVTVAIIVLLIGILLPMLVGARKRAFRTRIAMDLQGISQGLEAYRGDFRDYPRVDYGTANPITTTDTTNNPTPPTDRLGAVTLCWALLSPGPATATAGGDGADGPGFRVRGIQGQVYGPYLQPGKFNVSGTSDWNSTINDARGNPYLYFAAFTGADIHNVTASATTVGGGYANSYVPSNSVFTTMQPPLSATNTPQPMYNYVENPIKINNNQFTLQQMQTALGDTNLNGQIDPGESAATTAPYLLWSAGADDIYGTADDVTNFNQ